MLTSQEEEQKDHYDSVAKVEKADNNKKITRKNKNNNKKHNA